jgi:hypothetical protein
MTTSEKIITLRAGISLLAKRYPGPVSAFCTDLLVSTEGESEGAEDISKAASALGRLGGRSKSEGKVAASRANGAKGGRPKKSPVDARGGPKNESGDKSRVV